MTAYLLYVPADHGEGETLERSGVVLEERMGYNIIPGWVIILCISGGHQPTLCASDKMSAALLASTLE